jgi:hypothetical protein
MKKTPYFPDTDDVEAVVRLACLTEDRSDTEQMALVRFVQSMFGLFREDEWADFTDEWWSSWRPDGCSADEERCRLLVHLLNTE